MLNQILTAMLFLAIVIPIGAYFIGEKKAKRYKTSLFVNIAVFFGTLLFATVVMFTNTVHVAASADVLAANNGLAFLGAAISTGLGSIGAGIATGSAASAALGALSENDGIMGKALIFVGLAEGIAIYGFVISFLILNNVAV